MANTPVMVGDIGGTNARFGIVEDISGAISHIDVFSCADFPTLSDALQEYLSRCGIESPPAGAIAVATPVTSDNIEMTNHVWKFSIEETRKRLGFERLLVLNDFTALALSLPRLPQGDIVQIGGGTSVASRPVALVGPGTGLGVSGLIPSADGWIPLQTEGGHVTLSPANEREMDILNHLWRDYSHVSAERLLSGPGLVLLHTVISELRGEPVESVTAAQISERGVTGTCPTCAEVMDIFCSMLGTVSGNLALTLGAQGGVYVGGGIVPRLGDFFAQSGFRSAFEHHGRFSDYLAAIPTYVITAPYPALTGVAEAFYSEQPGVGMMSE